VPSRLRDIFSGRRVWAYLLVTAVAVAGVAIAGLTLRSDSPDVAGPAPRAAAVPSMSASTLPPAAPAAPAPDDLPTFSYFKAPRGLPADPAPTSTAAVTEGLRLTADRVVYDKPGGTPKAVLPASMSGLPVTVPIVERRTGWVAVLLPSTNRRVGWLPAEGSAPVALRDQLVLRRRTHELTWIRDGARQASWTVTTGAPATATPLGRTFVLGRVAAPGQVYAGLDALALGSVPDDPDSLPASLRAGHTALHSWYRASAFGRSISNGCIRVPKKGQRTLLKSIPTGTVVHVVD
jgi:lipoprotein-anchoring transpeptidase ErfK/SrfK